MRWTVVLTLLLALSTGPVRAADPPRAAPEMGPEGVWSNACDIDRMTDTRACRLMAYRTYEDGRDVGFVSLSVIPTGTDYHLFLTTSQGLIDSCAIRVDRQPRIETRIATVNMCMFPNFLSGRILDQFRNGQTVLVRVNFARGNRRDMDFSLNGFGRNFEEIQRSLQ